MRRRSHLPRGCRRGSPLRLTLCPVPQSDAAREEPPTLSLRLAPSDRPERSAERAPGPTCRRGLARRSPTAVPRVRPSRVLDHGRIAQEVRHAVNGWRHGAAVDAFAAERAEVLAEWDELRERTRSEGDAVALSPAFRETLNRHAALMKQARMFRTRPQVYERLLAERAGIGRREFEELGEVHARAGSYLRSVNARTASAAREAAQSEQTRTETVAVHAPDYTPEPAVDEHAQVQPREPAASDRTYETESAWETLYDRLERDWNDLVAVANRAGLPLPLVRGYDELIGRVGDLAEHPRLPSTEHRELAGLLDYHRAETAARKTIHDYIAAAERHVKACESLQRDAESQGVHVSEVTGWPEWRDEAQRLEKAGRAILADQDTYGAYLDAVAAGKPRARLTVDQLRSRIQDGHVKASKADEPTPRREPAEVQREGIAHILEDPERLRELRAQLKRRERKMGRHRQRSRGLTPPLDSLAMRVARQVGRTLRNYVCNIELQARGVAEHQCGVASLSPTLFRSNAHWPKHHRCPEAAARRLRLQGGPTLR